MTAVSIAKAGDHFTFVDGEALGSAIQTANWKAGAIMDECVAIRLATGQRLTGVRFVGVTPERQEWLSSLLVALAGSGPVNVGLTDESDRGGLRIVFYFADDAMLKRRMDAAIAAI